MKAVEKGLALLINPNAIKPLVGPVALDYLSSVLKKRDYAVDILDLAFLPDFGREVRRYFQDRMPDVVGITVRNTDDCYYASQEFFIPKIKEIVYEVKRWTNAPVVLGGCGFSIMPQEIMSYCNADFGIRGEGEEAFGVLIDRLIEGKDYSGVHGLVYREGEEFLQSEPRFADLDALAFSDRTAVDNRRYFQEGGQGSIETKRGCNKKCIYCADPIAKGTKVRVRSPQSVVTELESLYSKGIDCFHLCDSEFNNPIAHAEAICEEIIKSRLHGKITWYTYASPYPFTEQLALLMRESGCLGIDFGVDSGDDLMLNSLGRDFKSQEVQKTAEICHRVGMIFMFDLLFGAPGETRESVKHTIELMKRIEPSRVGLSVGVRIYPGTKLAEMAVREGINRENRNLFGCVDDNESLLKPIFYLSSKVAADISDLLAELIGNDSRFFFANPTDVNQNYNYNENQVLVDAIKQGYRGAYWDILRRLHAE